jgi:hypothetical protein
MAARGVSTIGGPLRQRGAPGRASGYIRGMSTPLTALLVVLLGCEPAAPPPVASPHAYADAVVEVLQRPTETVAICGALSDSKLQADCVATGAKELAAKDPAGAAVLCAALPEGVGRDECHFQVAERSGDVAHCAQAGRFADDCRLHRLSQDFKRLIGADAVPGGFEEGLAPVLLNYGFAADDPRPWSAAYRWVLGGHRPLDRASCSQAPSPSQVDACRMTALALYNDLLNHARDSKLFPCDGGPLPERLSYLPDPDLDAIIERRRKDDLCR